VWQAKKWVYPGIDSEGGEALHVRKEQGLPCHMRGLITADLCNSRPTKQIGSSRKSDPDFRVIEETDVYLSVGSAEPTKLSELFLFIG